MEKLKKELSFFDLTNIVIGSIIGADIYIVSALTAGMIGPFSIFVWLIAGIFTIVIALVFAYCSYYCPKVGGPFAFVSKAFDNFYGFITGWSMWIAEILALPVFAIAFVSYLQYFITLNFSQQILVKGLFLFGLTFINIVGVRLAGRINDILTLVKLLPLFLLVVAGLVFLGLHPKNFLGNYSPLIPFGLGNFGTALVLIFWAYAGFELGTLPASEVKNPKKTIPKAIITGTIIVTLFYLMINFVVYGTVSWHELSTTSTPLIIVGAALVGTVGAIIMSLGALLSVSGSDESGVLTTARLSYAMSIEGLFPKLFSKVHARFKTPYTALIVQGIIAFALSIFSGLSALISFSVFTLAFSFLFVCLALIVLKRGREKELHGQNILPWIGILICLYLLYQTSSFNKILGLSVILLGIPLYIFFSPKADIRHLKRMFVSEEAIITRRLERKEKFLANFFKIMHRIYEKLKKDEYD
jgi:amino acid transporter